MPTGLIGERLPRAARSCRFPACKGQPEHDIVRQLPGIGTELTLRGSITLRDGLHQAMKGARRCAADTAPDQSLPVPPDAGFLHRGAEVDPLPNRVRQAGQ
jgi:hypothetical protein